MYVIYTEYEIFVIIYKHNIFRISIKMLYSQNTLADPRGAPGTRAPPPPGSKFFHFHAVFGKKLKNNSTFGSWRPPWGKSWIRHWNIKYLISTMYVSIFAKDALLTSSYFDVHFHLN